jgi:hypothetical protein
MSTSYRATEPLATINAAACRRAVNFDQLANTMPGNAPA